jgi:hypothetical protein
MLAIFRLLYGCHRMTSVIWAKGTIRVQGPPGDSSSRTRFPDRVLLILSRTLPAIKAIPLQEAAPWCPIMFRYVCMTQLAPCNCPCHCHSEEAACLFILMIRAVNVRWAELLQDFIKNNRLIPF